MPTIKGRITAATQDALASEKLRKISGPAVVTLAAVGQTATDRIKLSYGTTELSNALQPNLVTDADAGPVFPDDVLVDGAVLSGGGELSLECTAVGAQINYTLVIQPV